MREETPPSWPVRSPLWLSALALDHDGPRHSQYFQSLRAHMMSCLDRPVVLRSSVP